MSSTILFDAKVRSRSTRHYGVLEITNIHYEDKTPVKIEKNLNITFISPAPINNRSFRITPYPSITFTKTGSFTTMDSYTQTDLPLYNVSGKLSVAKPYTIERLTIDISIEGDLTKEPKRYTESIVITVD
jgi:hypothetical protein